MKPVNCDLILLIVLLQFSGLAFGDLQPVPFLGEVQNVSLSISTTSVHDLAEIFANKTLSQNFNQLHSPLLLNLHVKWSPPVDKGSTGVIDHYVIRLGRVKRNLFPIPPEFIKPVKTYNLASDIVEFTIELPTDIMPYDYGVQIIAFGSGQVQEERDFVFYKIHVIQVSNSGTNKLTQSEILKTLFDDRGIQIMSLEGSIPVIFFG